MAKATFSRKESKNKASLTIDKVGVRWGKIELFHVELLTQGDVCENCGVVEHDDETEKPKRQWKSEYVHNFHLFLLLFLLFL